jgi:heme/copper-type cytochrome/quinol oxidase subunit 2
MKNIPNKLASMLCHAGVWAGAWVATAAHAVNDLPGGPAVNQLNLPEPATKIAAEQNSLHWMMLILCTVIFVAVFSVMFYSVWKHRKSKGHQAANFHESVTVEIVWTVIPFIIVILMALPATKLLVAQKDTTNADLTIKATGYQWKWGYDYLKGEGEGIGFISTLDNSHRVMSNAGKPQGDNYLLKVDNPLVVPVGKKIRIITTANDVIHAFAVPQFGIKQDAIHAHDDHHHHAPTGWRRWVFATNHKDIGTLYLLFSFTMLMVGGVLALMIRAELFQPGLQVVNPELFNQLTTMHGLIMVFGAIMPAFVGFANWMIPLQIGASDMAFARMNNFSFWLLIPAGIMLVGSFFMPGGAPAAGWTLYAPLTLQMGMSMDTSIFAMHIMGASSIMGAINIIVTILNMRAPGLTLMKMSMFCWTWLITAYLLIAVMPVLAGAITMTLTDRHFGTSFFNPAGGGDPIMTGRRSGPGSCTTKPAARSISGGR